MNPFPVYAAPRGLVLRPLLFILLSLSSASALAADATAMPPQFRGDVSIGYQGAFEQVGLSEQNQTWGIRNTVAHALDVSAAFSVYKGLALSLDLPITLTQRIRFPAARDMQVDPLTGRGSYTEGLPIEAPDLVSKGLQGAWIGLVGSPLREGWAASLPLTLNLNLDLALRTPGRKHTLFADPRGASPGGLALRMGLAMSHRVGKTDAWFDFHYQREFASKPGPVALPEATSASADLAFKGPDRIDTRAGGSFIVGENTDKQKRIALDLWAGFGWRGESSIASGFLLPSVLPTSAGLQTTGGAYMLGQFGIGLQADFNRWFGLRLGFDGTYFSPRYVEAVYDVSTDPQSFGLGWSLTLTGRARTAADARNEGEALPQP